MNPASDSSVLGGKASSWVRLRDAGVLVPDGFAITAGEELTTAAIAGKLEALLERTSTATVAVRSSGVGEDGAARALAGLFESFLDVPAVAEDVLEAATRCRAAGRSARARSAMGEEVPMGVLVQEMIHPDLSGVLFTQAPLGEVQGMVVDAVQGHLGRLVDGRGEARRLVLDPSGSKPEPFHDLDLDALHAVCRYIEDLFGSPVDIEWAQMDGSIVVLQARPITGLAVATKTTLELAPVTIENASKFPPAVRQHDKVALRLDASELGIGISNGFVALASTPSTDQVDAAAELLAGWGEFIAVLLSPFDLNGKILRRFGAGQTARRDLADFISTVAETHDSFAFLLKEVQETASTGVAVLLPDNTVHVELVHGHFVTKGFADPTVYVLDAAGEVLRHEPGNQAFAMQLEGGNKVRVPVEHPIEATSTQLHAIRSAAVGLAERYPGAGVEFGFTPDEQFFLVDLYQSAATTPPERSDVLSQGRVVGVVRVLQLPGNAVEESVERHVHSRRESTAGASDQPEILVVDRPLHVLDQLIYGAAPGTLGFICEGGALLCHLAVVMREHGVPGLIVPDATRTFVDGERVVLDTRPGSTAALTRL